MALRLSEHVTCGELYNLKKNSVHGVLGLRGIDRPLSLQLTGNCAADLAGRAFRFEVREEPGAPAPESCKSESDSDSDSAWLERHNLKGLAWQQIGPTGIFTAAQPVRVANCSPTELYNRCKLGEPPPTTWKPCLRMEWFSQNGRVVIELVDPIIEFIDPDRERDVAADDAADEPLPFDDSPDQGQRGLGITSIRINDDGEVEVRDESPDPDDDDSSEGPHDPYCLIPDDLQRQFDAAARETDRSIGNDPEGDEVIRELELMDELMERGTGEPLVRLLGDGVSLPSPDALDDRQAEMALMPLLGRLALFGIALDMCEHYSLADAYRLLVKRIGPEATAHPQLRGTQWVQHFATSDYCPECDAEFERDYQRRHGPGPDPA